MRTLANIVFNLVLMACIACSELKGISAAGNVAMFVSWFIIIITILGLFFSEKVYERMKSENKVHIPTARILSVSVVSCMVIFGWMITAAFFLFSILITHVQYLSWLELQERDSKLF